MVSQEEEATLATEQEALLRVCRDGDHGARIAAALRLAEISELDITFGTQRGPLKALETLVKCETDERVRPYIALALLMRSWKNRPLNGACQLIKWGLLADDARVSETARAAILGAVDCHDNYHASAQLLVPVAGDALHSGDPELQQYSGFVLNTLASFGADTSQAHRPLARFPRTDTGRLEIIDDASGLRAVIAAAKRSGANALAISFRRGVEITKELWERTDLKSLTLHADRHAAGVREFPPGIKVLKGLMELNIINHQLKIIPKEIGALKHLTTLRITNGPLTELPTNIGRISTLKTLSLSDNMLTEVPPVIEKLTGLTHLDLSGNRLEELPGWIGELQELIHLSLQRNDLHALPAQIGTLKRLRSLNVSENHFRTLPPEIGALEDLETLKAAGYGLQSLPDTIGQLMRLDHLDLSGNELEALPASFGDLTALNSLDLSKNPLSDLSRLEGLTTLETLSIGGTYELEVGEHTAELYGNPTLPAISDLSSLAQLKCVRELTLVDHGVKDLSPLEKLPKLTHLRLGGGPIAENAAVVRKLEERGVTVEWV